MLSPTYGLGGRGGGLRPDPPLGGCWGGAFFSGVPQLLGGFGGAGSTSSVSVPRMGMGGGVPPPSWNTLSGISVMLTEIGRSPVCGYNQMWYINRISYRWGGGGEGGNDVIIASTAIIGSIIIDVRTIAESDVSCPLTFH